MFAEVTNTEVETPHLYRVRRKLSHRYQDLGVDEGFKGKETMGIEGKSIICLFAFAWATYSRFHLINQSLEPEPRAFTEWQLVDIPTVRRGFRGSWDHGLSLSATGRSVADNSILSPG